MCRDTFLEQMTMQCPHCNAAVDPDPDGCSAVLCLNCGQYYCNYCFKGYSLEGKLITSEYLYKDTLNFIE